MTATMYRPRRNRRKSKGPNIFVVGFVVVVILLALFGGNLIDESNAADTLENQGWTDVTVVDRAVVFIQARGCGEHDQVRFTAEATNPAGQRVEVYVCKGWLKAGTIRTP
jgi:hypothetical protein